MGTYNPPIQSKTNVPEKQQSILNDYRLAEAVAHYKRRWPEHLTSGILFWDGLRITRIDFNSAP